MDHLDALQFRVLGPVDVRDGGWSPPRGRLLRALLAAFLLRANRSVEPAWLIRHMWPERTPPSADANLRQYITRLRRELGRCGLDSTARIVATWPGYRLQVSTDAVDLALFQRLSSRGRRALAGGDLSAAQDDLSAAAALWQGELCEGMAGGPDLEVERTYWSEMRLAAAEALMTTYLGTGAYPEAVRQLQMLTTVFPFREELRALLMLSLYRSHRRGEALLAYTAARRILVGELGIEPGPRLRRLHQAILADDPLLVSDEWSATAPLAAQRGTSA
jgi:DNA-binding SARP family transcriptional activator